MSRSQHGSVLRGVSSGARVAAAAACTAAALVLLALSGGGSVAASAQEPGAPTLQIFNGEDADIDDVPSVVAVFPPGGQCTGTVIGEEWVLTASHCFDDFDGDAEEVFVAVGTDQAEELFEAAVQAEDVLLHPDYDDDTLEADIALIKLAEPVDAPPATLAGADAQPPIGDDALLVGWGLLDEGTEEEPDVLQRGEMQFTDCAEPLTSFAIPADIHDRYVCLTSDVTEACVGDSGGPAFQQLGGGGLVQFGVLAFGSDLCQEAPHVSIYASVPYYLDWLVDTSGLALGEPEELADEPSTPRFTDVAGSRFATEIDAVVDAGIARGVGGDRFDPAGPVTRGQMAAFLFNALELSEAPDSGLVDVPDSRFATEIDAVVDAGIARGVGGDRFDPAGPVTRGQMAAFLFNALELGAE